MAYGILPFQQTDSGNLFGGEPIAPTWKRILAALVDYGVPAVLYALAYVNTELSEYSGYQNPTTNESLAGQFLPILIFINSGLVQGIYGQSLGKAITRTTLVTKVGRRLEAPGAIRGSLRLLVPILIYYIGYLDFADGGINGPVGNDSDIFGKVFIAILLFSYAMFFFDPKNRTVFDHLTRTATIDVAIRRRNDEAFGNPNVRRH